MGKRKKNKFPLLVENILLAPQPCAQAGGGVPRR